MRRLICENGQEIFQCPYDEFSGDFQLPVIICARCNLKDIQVGITRKIPQNISEQIIITKWQTRYLRGVQRERVNLGLPDGNGEYMRRKVSNQNAEKCRHRNIC